MPGLHQGSLDGHAPPEPAPADGGGRFVDPAPGAASPDKLRLFCFPHSGAGASVYRLWRGAFPDGLAVWPVQLPGRESRFGEPPFRRLGPLVEGLAGELGRSPGFASPYAFFGHSLGALIAFELARWLARTGAPGPVRLFVSACRAPHLPNPWPPLAGLPRPAFLEALARLGGGLDPALEHPELLELLEPTLRADFEVSESYVHGAGPPLGCPITACGGRADPVVPQAALEAWREHTRTGFRLRLYPGGHLYHRDARPRLTADIAADLSNRGE